MVRNPMNPQSVSKITLNPHLIDCIVFWTKNPQKMMKHLEQLKGYCYYFLFTITPYGGDLEKFLPPKDQVIEMFIELSRRIGKERVIWRYDPVIFTNSLDFNYHCREFDAIAQRLNGFTEKCITSFLDMYKKCRRNLMGFEIIEIKPEEKVRLISYMNQAARNYDIHLVTCAEAMDFSSPDVPPGKCIDDRLIARIAGFPLNVKKDRNQRKNCKCVESIDIGAYNTCPHICLYCYANYDEHVVGKNSARHNPDSPLLIGQLSPSDKIVERKIESFKELQPSLL